METIDLYVKQSELENFVIDSTSCNFENYIQANLEADSVMEILNSPFKNTSQYKNSEYFISATLYIRGTKNEDKLLLEIDYTTDECATDDEPTTVIEFYNIVGENAKELRDSVLSRFMYDMADFIKERYNI